MRVLHGVLCLLYALAAAVQWNDPDPAGWIAIYAGAALVAGAAAAGRSARWPALGIAGIALAWAATLAPEALDGLRTSPGEVFGAMSMHARHVEEAREALGLVLVAAGMASVAWQARAMASPPRPWTVTPHGPLERIDDDLWSIESPVPGLPGGLFPRRMTIVRRADGSLLFHNAIPVDDALLADLRALGTAAVLVVPNPIHALDAQAFRDQLGVRAVASRGCLDELRTKTSIDGAIEDLPDDPRCRFLPLAGLRDGEHVLAVTSPDGARVSLVLGDQILNVPHRPGLWGLAWRLIGVSGPAKMAPLWRMKYLADGRAYRRSFEALADVPGLARLVPSHGPVIEQDPGAVVRHVVRTLPA